METPGYVVRVFGKTREGDLFNGTGIIVSQNGHVITCWHVVSQAAEIQVQLPYPYNRPGQYQVCGRLERDDLALLESLVPLDVPTYSAPLHPNWGKDTQPGNDVNVWGFSTEEFHVAPQHIPCTIRGFDVQHGRIGLSADINPGDSGGPVVNSDGKVIGIVNAKDSQRVGHGQAIPISLVINLFEEQGIVSKFCQTELHDEQKPMNFEQKAELVDALLACDNMRNRDTRNTIVDDLPVDIRSNIQRNPRDQIDVVNIVNTCLDYSDGIVKLIEIVRFYEGNSNPMQTLDGIFNRIQPELTPPPMRPKFPKCEIPWILPYLPNRGHQETELSELLKHLQENKPHRPVICIVHCDEGECNDTYMDRLEKYSLFKLLNLDRNQHLITRKSFKWTPNTDIVDNRFKILLSNLADSLTGNRADAIGSQESLMAKLFQVISTHNASIFMIESHLNAKNCGSDEPELIKRFVDFWNQYPNLPLDRFLFVFLCIVYKKMNKVGFWQRHFGQKGKLEKLNNSIENFVKNLNFSDYDKLHGVTLEKLPAILEEEAQDWVRNEVRDFFSAQKIQEDELSELELCLIEKIHSIYAETKCIPMRQLAKQLKMFLKEAWA